MRERRINFFKVQVQMYAEYLGMMALMMVVVFGVLPYGLGIEMLKGMNLSFMLGVILTIIGSTQFSIATQLGLTGGFSRRTQLRQLVLIFAAASVLIATLYFGLVGILHVLHLRPILLLNYFAHSESGVGNTITRWVLTVVTFFCLQLAGIALQMLTIKWQLLGKRAWLGAALVGMGVMVLLIIGMVIGRFTVHVWRVPVVLIVVCVLTVLLALIVRQGFRRFDLPRK